MSYVSTLIEKIIMMFLLIALGVFLEKRKYFSNQFIKELGSFLFDILAPFNVVSSFMIGYTPERGKQFIYAFVISAIIYVISIIISNILFKKEKFPVEHYATVISNCGFLGLPIVRQVCGEEAGIYAVAFIVFNICVQMTYGKYVMSLDKNDISIKSIATATSVIASVFGILYFFLRIPVIAPVQSCLSALSSTVAPISCILIGVNLANTDLKSFIKDKESFLSIAIRQLVVPLITVVLLKFISNDMYIMKLTIAIVAASPAASGTSVFARTYNKDYEMASRLVCVGTILLIITMPLVTSIATLIW